MDEKITKPNYLRKQLLADEQIKHSQVSKKALTYGWKNNQDQLYNETNQSMVDEQINKLK